MTHIETERLKLTPCQPADRGEFIGLELDAEVMRFLNGGVVDHQNVDPDEAPFLMRRGTESNVWTARRRDDGIFVGWFSLVAKSAKTAELGYRLRRAQWGQGLATEGARALLHWGFANLAYEEVKAATMAVNSGSRRVMEKIGMRRIGTDFPSFTDPIPGSEFGEVLYQVRRADWVKP